MDFESLHTHGCPSQLLITARLTTEVQKAAASSLQMQGLLSWRQVMSLELEIQVFLILWCCDKMQQQSVTRQEVALAPWGFPVALISTSQLLSELSKPAGERTPHQPSCTAQAHRGKVVLKPAGTRRHEIS